MVPHSAAEMIESNDTFVLLWRHLPSNVKIVELTLEVVKNFGSLCEWVCSALDSSADIEELRDR